ncbi:MAG TPA: carbohydrate kinase family protein [Candidatus Limnocylindrales bacterium]|nr:carbohydrate kinase family protein [Candidatus Limnocylindrales bacterium]
MAGSVPGREFDLLVAGELNPDIVVSGDDVEPAFGQVERLVRRIALTVGSSSAITACGAARLGLRVAFVGVVGDDPFGRWMLEALAARGVDVGACRVDSSLPTGASVILARPDDRAILTSTGTMAALTADDLPDGLLARADHIHVGSLFLQDRLRAGLAGVFGRAKALGLTTSFDPGWDPSGTWDGGISSILEATVVVLPNREEARRITDGEGDLEAGQALAARGPVVAMKLGPQGGLVVTRDAAARLDAPDVEIVDAIGAGDAFDAGFLAGWLDGRPPADCLRLAVACGSLSVRAAGGTEGQPKRQEAEELAGRLVARAVALPSSFEARP